MARKITRNDLKNEYRYIACISYCDLQTITKYLREVGYNHGVYGWNYTVYEIDYDTCIATGYRTSSIGGTYNREIVKKYENKMRKYEEKYSGINYSWKKREAYAKKLVAAFKNEFFNL